MSRTRPLCRKMASIAFRTKVLDNYYNEARGVLLYLLFVNIITCRSIGNNSVIDKYYFKIP